MEKGETPLRIKKKKQNERLRKKKKTFFLFEGEKIYKEKKNISYGRTKQVFLNG
jgi:hypothetical protein